MHTTVERPIVDERPDTSAVWPAAPEGPTQAAGEPLGVDEALHAALDAITSVTESEIAGLHLVTPDGGALRLAGHRGWSPQLEERQRLVTPGEGLVGLVAATGEAVHVASVAEPLDAVLVGPGERIHAFVCAPVRVQGRVVGTLALGRRKPQHFSDAEVALVEATARQIAVVLDHVRCYLETRRQLDELRRVEAHLIQTERLSTTGRLMAGLAHEINNPLTSITGHAQLLHRNPALPPDGRAHLALIIQETSRVAQTLRNVLLFARPAPQTRRPCSLAELLAGVLALLRPQLAEDRIEVVTELGDCPALWCDATQIQQVVLNLVQNAQQAMAGRMEPRVLTLRCDMVDAEAQIEVLDTGPGFAPDVLPRIFDPFFTTRPDGHGLGLWVSLTIVEQHGGRLFAQNRRAGGAAFVIRLPYRREPAAPGAALA